MDRQIIFPRNSTVYFPFSNLSSKRLNRQRQYQLLSMELNLLNNKKNDDIQRLFLEQNNWYWYPQNFPLNNYSNHSFNFTESLCIIVYIYKQINNVYDLQNNILRSYKRKRTKDPFRFDKKNLDYSEFIENFTKQMVQSFIELIRSFEFIEKKIIEKNGESNNEIYYLIQTKEVILRDLQESIYFRRFSN